MAKNDNLKDFLTDVADAIRAKKGTSAEINPQDFSAEIASIEEGGGVVVENDVNFRDYDGTLLHSYTKDEFLALAELPPLPSQPGLVCQGWNYTFEDARDFVGNYGKINIGATYITDDGKTRLYISVLKGRQDVPLVISQTIANGVIINWGDGSGDESNATIGNNRLYHHYEREGDYIITLDVKDGCVLGFGTNSTSNCIMGMPSTTGMVYCSMLKRVEIGKGVTTIGNGAFYTCRSLASIVIPQGVTTIGTYVFASCVSLALIVIPQGVTQIGDSAFNSCVGLTSIAIPKGITKTGSYVFQNCSNLASMVIPQGVTTIDSNAFRSCSRLSSIVIPQSVTAINTYAFNTCACLTSIVIPQGVTTISNYTFQNCYALASIVIPQSVATIGVYAFATCYGMALIDCRLATSVPTMSATSSFSSLPTDCKIVVPDALYDDWIVASNWSTLSAQIVKASEYTE